MMHATIEIRQTPLELRATGRGIEGYAALFDSESLDLGGFTETVGRGAFANTLARDLVSDPVLFLWGHDANQPLASTRPGTLQLREDARGLAFAAQLPATSWANDALEAVKAGLAGASFGFTIRRERWEGRGRRILEDVDLREISLTPMPAYSATIGQQAVRMLNGRSLNDAYRHVSNRLIYQRLRR